MRINFLDKKLFLSLLFLFSTPSNSIDLINFSREYSKKNNQVLVSQTKKENFTTETVLATGSGLTIEEAIQDASVNALKQVSGTLIDTETKYKNESKFINNSLVDEKELFEEKIRDYSQGSIKSYEIINSFREGDFYKVEGRFDVVIENFQPYTKKSGSGTKKIKKGLFAKIITDNKESSSKIDFFKKIVYPIHNGEVLDVQVGDLISAKDFISPSRKEKETVVVKGFGESLKSATQNAAFNALTKVAGSFIDAETYFKYKEEINNSIVKQSESFKNDVAEYSRGAITFFDIIKEKKEGGIYTIEAEVTVGFDNFKSYLDDLFAFGSNVSSYSDSLCMQIFGYDYVCNKDFSFFREKSLVPENTILIPFEISLRDGYLENTEKILRETSAEDLAFKPSPFSYYNFSDFDPSLDHIITIIDLKSNTPNVSKYLIKDIKSTLKKQRNASSSQKSDQEKILYGISCKFKNNENVKPSNLEIRFLDEKNNVIYKINPDCIEPSKKGEFIIFESPIKNMHNTEVREIPWMSLYTRSDECLKNSNNQDFELCENQIVSKRNFWLAFQPVDFEIFNNLAQIEIIYLEN